MDETKKKRTMTPDMLQKLAVAREKAMIVRRQIKAERDARELEDLPAKLEQKAKIKAELEKPKEPRPEFRTKKTIPEDNPVMDSLDDSEPSDVDEPPPPPVKTKKKQKKIVVVEESSSDEETYVYVPKRQSRMRPPPKPKVEYTEPVEWSQPPIPLPPPPPQAPSYNELARAHLNPFGGFPRRF